MRLDPLHQPQDVLVASTQRDVCTFDLERLIQTVRARFGKRSRFRQRLYFRVAETLVERERRIQVADVYAYIGCRDNMG